MADQDQGPLIVGQQLFQEVQRVHVQVVCGLVQHQQVGRLGQGAGQEQAVALPARKAFHRLAQLALVEQEVLCVGGHVPGLAADHHLIAAQRRQGLPEGQVGLQRCTGLVKVGDFKVGPELH